MSQRIFWQLAPSPLVTPTAQMLLPACLCHAMTSLSTLSWLLSTGQKRGSSGRFRTCPPGMLSHFPRSNLMVAGALLLLTDPCAHVCRARNGITDAQVNVDVCVFLFDLLFVDGRGMMQTSFRDRRHALTKIFPNLRQGHVEMAHGFELVIPAAGGQSTQPAVADDDQSSEGAANLHTPSQKEVAEQQQSAQFAESRDEGLRTLIKQCGPEQAGTLLEHTLLQALAVGAEGLMLKFLDTRCAYQPSKRSDSWLKLKKDYCEGLRDSLDLVPIGAWYGNGRKAGWYSPYLLACWDPEAEEFQSVCRVMSGFSDAFYTAAKERFDSKHLIPGPKPYYNTGESPNVWFDAAEVWEIRGADITLSPIHKAAVGKVHESRGCSLRFPRFIQIRDDKSPEDASSGDYIVDLYNAQARKRDDS
eukprot:jgi/Ulvmu1/7917/UM004_0149.1